jgi:hypothetical protein
MVNLVSFKQSQTMTKENTKAAQSKPVSLDAPYSLDRPDAPDDGSRTG